MGATKAKWKKQRLTFYNGAVDDQAVGKSTATSTAVANYGVTLVKTGSSAGSWTINDPVLGARKTIVIGDTTKIININLNNATLNGSTIRTITVTPTTATRQSGFVIDLYGASTVLWYGGMGLSDINSTQLTVTYTSST